MCITCSKKENLKLNIPEQLDQQLVTEYINQRESNQLDPNRIFDYFIRIYGDHWVRNPKQIRRAMINMEELYYKIKRDGFDQEASKGQVEDQLDSDKKVERGADGKFKKIK